MLLARGRSTALHGTRCPAVSHFNVDRPPWGFLSASPGPGFCVLERLTPQRKYAGKPALLPQSIPPKNQLGWPQKTTSGLPRDVQWFICQFKLSLQRQIPSLIICIQSCSFHSQSPMSSWIFRNAPTWHEFEEFGSEISVPILFLYSGGKNASLSPIVWGEDSGRKGETQKGGLNKINERWLFCFHSEWVLRIP